MDGISTSETRSAAIVSDPRWKAVVARDAAADGRFFYSVKTTGVYCRPSCSARTANPENVAFHATAAEAERAGFRPCKRCRPNGNTKTKEGVAIDWNRVSDDLDRRGSAVVEKLLPAAECDAIAALYADQRRFRSRVVMARHGFGQGEYQYFGYPLPAPIARLRTSLYPPLADIANRWNAAMHVPVRFPPTHAAFLKRCHAAGQRRPTPLLLQYGSGDYNCLHQDLYGEHVFPLQLTILLSEPGKDFTGGEFVMTEQRPRMQSRAEVVPLSKGDAVIFAVHTRPVHGTRGIYRVNMRHGVSRVHSGKRYTAGIIFHDAA